MRKMRTRETAAAKVRTSAHAAEAHAAHRADMHPSSHAAGMHATSHTAAVHATATTAAATERRCRKGKRGSKCTRDEATKDLVVHPDFLRG